MVPSITPHSIKWSGCKKSLSIATAILENILFCGIIYGWPGIGYVYENSCFFIDEIETCEIGNRNFTSNQTQNVDIINQQTIYVADVLRRSVQAFIATGFILGIVYDKIGTRNYRILVGLLYLAGCILGGLATPGSEL